MKNKKKVFVVAGASRCGTTSFYEILRKQNCFGVHRKKEGRYFDQCVLSDKKKYLSEFLDHEEVERFVDISPPYFHTDIYFKNGRPKHGYNNNIANRIANDPDVDKVLLILRKPSERLISQFRKNVVRGVIKENNINKFLAADAGGQVPLSISLLHRARYSVFVSEYRDLLRDRLMIMDFNVIVHSRTDVLSEVLREANPAFKSFTDEVKHMNNKSYAGVSWFGSLKDKLSTLVRVPVLELNAQSQSILSDIDKSYPAIHFDFK
ncbi:hypothetical protein N9755_01405 [bacterium]|nr:hypothetical protein [bacterium]